MPQTKKLSEDGELTFIGNYMSWKDLAARKNIITARGPWARNNALIKTYKTDGTHVTPDFTALDSRYGANIAIGDIDGDGTAEIIVGAGAGPENSTMVRVYKAGKTAHLVEFEAYPGLLGGVNVAAADFDADGKAELIVAPAGGADNPGTVKIVGYDSVGNKMVRTGIEFTAHNNLTGVNLAAADLDGNFSPRLVTAPVSGTDSEPGAIALWKIDTSGGMGNWTAAVAPAEIPLLNRYGATVAAGDMDGDGKEELIAGVAPDKKTKRAAGHENSEKSLEKSLVKIFRADGSEVRRIPVFDGKYGVNTAAADLDGDGIAEIIAGLGAELGGATADNGEERKHKKMKTVRVYTATGSLKYAITPYDESRYGVKVAAGELGL
jgi:hypothetical protein